MGSTRIRGASRLSKSGRAFSPLSVAGAELWLRSDLGLTISSGVSAWGDQTPNARHVTQGTVGLRLGYSASDAAYNNKPVLVGTNLGYLDASVSGPASQPLTFYIVGQIGTSADYKTLVDAHTGNRAIVRANASEFSSTFAGTANVESTTSIAGPSIICAVFNGASSAHYVNSTTAAVTGNPGATGMGTIRIGAAPAGSYPLPTDGKLAEILIYSGAHGATTRATILRYLSTRYALTVTGL